MSADRLRWKEKGADAASKSLSSLDELRQRNLELLDLVIGTWTDQHDSVYSVQLDGGVEQNSCSVYTTRASGHTLKTKGLIRVQKGQVWWSSSFVLDRDSATWQEIKWIVHGNRAKKNFHWNRRKGETSQREVGMKVHAMRADTANRSRRRAKAEPKEPKEPKESPDDAEMENESDDDDIVAEPHPYNFERRPIPVSEIRWSQDTIGIRFRNGKLLVETLREMTEGGVQPEELPTFRVLLYEDLFYALTGNRRLWVLKELERVTGQQVKIFAEIHPPGAMQLKWCKRRYTTTSSGEKVCFLQKSFANVTYHTMQDALQAAGHKKLAEWYRSTSAEGAANAEGEKVWREKAETTWQADTWQGDCEAVWEGTGWEEDEQEEADANTLINLLSPDTNSSTTASTPTWSAAPNGMPEGERKLLTIAQEQLCSAAAQLLSAAREAEGSPAGEKLRRAAQQLQEAGQRFEEGDPVEIAAQHIQQAVEEIQWLDCNLALMLQQAAQMLIAVRWQPTAGAEPYQAPQAEHGFEVWDGQTTWAALSVWPQVWQWQLAGQMAGLQSYVAYLPH
eukprot:CAMPEP_0181506576 /NCGR_PEP_ID=MMETSP1110-20121109/58669_1 /TAXON_ID=174948 /ORGANISM="Symbiodinium sp., Strain CCMP421" /LENGTH=562 /DNA_ID=CAMNT_0023635645 /DNA_START=1 /DNA_END=1689 /DNA_ORIENTATION=-